ncbi:MAG: T9SS type A sorting domain-containing protein, partial [Flavobacteriales bacterium]
ATAVFLTAQTVFTPHSDFKLYPNPSSNYLFVENKEWIKRIKIYDIQSRNIFSENIHSKTKSIDVSTFSSGVYFIELHTENAIIRKEFVIQNDKK